MTENTRPPSVLVIGTRSQAFDSLVNALRQQHRVEHAHTVKEVEQKLTEEPALVLAQYQNGHSPENLFTEGISWPSKTFLILLEVPSSSTSLPHKKVLDLAYHYISSPWKQEEVCRLISRALEHYTLLQHYHQLLKDQPPLHPSSLSTCRDQEDSTFCEKSNVSIQSDKMAILGQMVAGIAHEINTPSGAINAAAVNLSHHLRLMLTSIQELVRKGLSQAHVQQVLGIVASMLDTLNKRHRKSSGEIRADQKSLATILHQQHVPDSRRIAREIARMGLAESIEDLLRLGTVCGIDPLLSLLHHCSRIIHSTKDIQVSIDILTRFITALKTYSYPQQAQPEFTDIHDGLETALVLLKNKLKHRIHVECRFNSIPSLWCYPGELIHVWINLLQNAVQAIEGEGTILLETFATDMHLGVKIQDSGKGIPSEEQPLIFDVNFTTKPRGEGTGLGLYIVRQIIEKHHGTIQVTSSPGQTTFEVLLPLNECF